MKFTPMTIPGVLLVEPDVHRDARGFFMESFQQKKYTEAGITEPFVQDNHSTSLKGVLRGLHFQSRKPQGKLIRVTRGAIWDVVVDIRRGSPAFGKWMSVELSAENFRQLWVPPGLAHGFLVLSDVAEALYKCTDYFDSKDDRTVRWNDPDLAIPWPDMNPILSAKDAAALTMRELTADLPAFTSAAPSPRS
jgi:dTDP-4-dehydrorhamnose 3,5-epimerase